MKLVMYWEGNENVTPEEVIKGALKIEAAKIEFDKVKVTNWMATVENWGICVIESDDEVQVCNAINMWRQAIPGIYKTVKLAPGIELETYGEKLMPIIQKLAKK